MTTKNANGEQVEIEHGNIDETTKGQSVKHIMETVKTVKSSGTP